MWLAFDCKKQIVITDDKGSIGTVKCSINHSALLQHVPVVIDSWMKKGQACTRLKGNGESLIIGPFVALCRWQKNQRSLCAPFSPLPSCRPTLRMCDSNFHDAEDDEEERDKNVAVCVADPTRMETSFHDDKKVFKLYTASWWHQEELHF